MYDCLKVTQKDDKAGQFEESWSEDAEQAGLPVPRNLMATCREISLSPFMLRHRSMSL